MKIDLLSGHLQNRSQYSLSLRCVFEECFDECCHLVAGEGRKLLSRQPLRHLAKTVLQQICQRAELPPRGTDATELLLILGFLRQKKPTHY